MVYTCYSTWRRSLCRFFVSSHNINCYCEFLQCAPSFSHNYWQLNSWEGLQSLQAQHYCLLLSPLPQLLVAEQLTRVTKTMYWPNATLLLAFATAPCATPRFVPTTSISTGMTQCKQFKETITWFKSQFFSQTANLAKQVWKCTMEQKQPRRDWDCLH